MAPWLRRFGRRRALPALLAAVMVFTATACGTPAATGKSDVLTQKATEQGRTQITVLVKYAFTINAFEAAVEEAFPDIDLVQVGNYTGNMGVAEYAARLEHDDLTDVVMTWPVNVGEEYLADRLLDLSGMEFTSRYNVSMLDSIAQDGALYYLPGPAQVRGIVYNKTLFAENGWEIPTSYEEFLSLCKAIEATGIRAIQLGFANSEVLDTAFIGYNYGNYFSRPQDIQWLDDYNAGRGNFGDHFDGALDVFQQMVDAGVWKSTDLTKNYSDREKMLFSRQCAMVEDSALMCGMGFAQTGTTDEFALMPFFNPGAESDWARLYMVCYIGLNKHLAETLNKAKYDLVLKLMDYISTPEGQDALSADTGAMYSSLTGTEPPDMPEIESLVDALSHGRYAIFPTLKNGQAALRQGLAGMLNQSLTKSEVIRMVDEANRSPSVVVEPEVIGEAAERFTLAETGGYLCDVIRDWSGSDVALFLDCGKDGAYNGKGVSGTIYQGDITSEDVRRIMPDLKSGDTTNIWITEMTGETLINTLEYGVQVENKEDPWFYYVSGLKVEFAPTAPLGSRIKSVTTADGKAIDLGRTYTVATTNGSVLEDSLLACEKTDTTAEELFVMAVRSAGTISPAKDGRFIVTQ